MHCLKFERVSWQLYVTIVFAFLSPAILCSQDLGVPADEIQRAAKGMEQPNMQMGPRIPEGMKVVAIRVSADNAISGLLNPGNKVDVIGIFKRRDRSTNLVTTNTRTFLKAVQVYSIGNRTRIDGNAKPRASHPSSIVGLLLTEKQSEALVFVQDNGSIKLVLRGDDVENDDRVDRLEDIIEMISEEEVEDIKVFKEIKKLRALVNDQEQILQQFKKRLKRLERLEQIKPTK